MNIVILICVIITDFYNFVLPPLQKFSGSTNRTATTTATTHRRVWDVAFIMG